jgi:hypothetical protein
MARLALLALTPLLFAAGCHTGSVASRPSSSSSMTDVAARLDRGDWMRSTGSETWKVYEERTVDGQSRPPRHIGYLSARDYRQERGGPAFRVYEVSTLNRKEVLGRIDELGRVTRYDAQRNGTFVESPLVSSTLENNVGAIFGTPHMITLEKTDARHMAFEALDTDSNGALDAKETAAFGTRLSAADTNKDGKLDFAEFNAIDSL